MPFTSAFDVSGLPGAFQAALHGVLTATRYETAVRDTMSCGGCTCSRGSFIGACLGAQVGLSANLIYSRAHILSLIYECSVLIFLGRTWGNPGVLEVQDPAIRLGVGAYQEDNQTPVGVMPFKKERTVWQTVELWQNSEWWFLFKCLDGRSQMFLFLLK